MAFDPVAFLNSPAPAAPSQQPVKPKAPFDPAAFLADPNAMTTAPAPVGEEISKAASFGRGALQGGTLGFADEISGFLESVGGSLGLTEKDKTYEQARDESRANFKAAEEANPLTSLAGNVGGSLATMLIPGANMAKAGQVLSKLPLAGEMLAGSTLAKSALLGAGLGGIEGAGHSTADSLGGVIDDAQTGAVTGGIMGGASDIAMGAAGKGIKYLGHQLNPTIQRLKAFGITDAGMRKAGGFEHLADGMEEFTARGGVRKLTGDNIPVEGFKRLDSQMDAIGASMHAKLDGQGGAIIDDDTILAEFWTPLQAKLEKEGLTVDKLVGDKSVSDLVDDVLGTGGNLEKLHDIKKKFGAEVNWSESLRATDPPIKTKLYKEATQLLNEMIISKLNSVSDELGEGIGDALRADNASYAKLSKLWPLMKENADTFQYSGDKGATLKIKDQLTGAGVGAALGSMTGIPGMGVAAGAASMIGGAALRSIPGRLARANAGEAIQKITQLGAVGVATKAAGDLAAEQQGLIPRTLQGAREWLQAHPNLVPPQLQQTVKDIMTSPDAAAEMQVRALMPLFDQFIAPSPYKSEFNGKVTAPQDRVTARQVILAQGLPPSLAAYHSSQLNKSGMLQKYHYAPPTQDYGDEVLNFNQRLTEMGY